MTIAAPGSVLGSGDMTVDKTDFDVKEFLVVIKMKEVKLAKFKDYERCLININFISLTGSNMILFLLLLFCVCKKLFSNFMA